ncbi:ABC transporter permease [Oceanicola sp. 22II-s10i]|uniref:ABC transporter permease n=1 Tax=Oceanicola sp. 22II-s10i TaxID=1317116 RepID=UPI0020CE37A6|nr:ABC transporter permease [Oceanicola sp. 22II-s10i]
MRTILALLMREMSTTYGRSIIGYLWAILEPAAGIMLLTFVFSLALRSPPIGTNFAIFYASGMLPFMAWMSIHQRVATAIRFSKPLLFYPGVTYLDAIVARVLLNAITQLMVFLVVMSGIIVFYDLDMILDIPAIALGLLMTLALATGMGTLNCYLMWVSPTWEKIWGVLTRPLVLLSCVLFTFDTVPQPYQNWLWWNPLVHLVGQTRQGVFATYDATYVSPLYVFGISLITFCLGLIFLNSHYRDMIND